MHTRVRCRSFVTRLFYIFTAPTVAQAPCQRTGHDFFALVIIIKGLMRCVVLVLVVFLTMVGCFLLCLFFLFFVEATIMGMHSWYKEGDSRKIIWGRNFKNFALRHC